MENLEKEIINNKNKFIYWDNKEEKSETLKSLADSRPIVLNSSSPIVVYTNNFSLDKEDNLVFESNYMLNKISGEHLNFSLLSSIIDKIVAQEDLNVSQEKVREFLNFIERISFDKDLKLSSLKDVLKYARESCEFYKEYYNDFVKNEESKMNILDLKIPNITYESTSYKLKCMLGNTAYFSLLLDSDEDISINTARAVNNLFLNRTSDGVFVNVACKEDSWPTYSNQNGVKLTPVVDYESYSVKNKTLQYIKRR